MKFRRSSAIASSLSARLTSTIPPQQADSQHQSNNLLDQPVEKRFERIFAERFISLSRVESILAVQISARDKKRYLRQLQQFWDLLFDRDEFSPHAQNNRVQSLANAFADYALIFRNPQLGQTSKTRSINRSQSRRLTCSFPLVT